AAYLVPVVAWLAGAAGATALLPLLSGAVAVRLVRTVAAGAQGTALNRVLAGPGRLHLLYGLLRGDGVLWARFSPSRSLLGPGSRGAGAPATLGRWTGAGSGGWGGVSADGADAGVGGPPGILVAAGAGALLRWAHVHVRRAQRGGGTGGLRFAGGARGGPGATPGGERRADH